VQHGFLTAERWSAFSRDQQLLMIANEMNRAAKLSGPGERALLSAALERVLRLVDLTIECRPRTGLCRELLRWRDLVAELYLSSAPGPARLLPVFRALLQLVPATTRQIPYLLRDA